MARFQQLLEESGVKTRSYSGRGMYSRTCLAAVVEEGNGPTDLIADLLEYVLHPVLKASLEYDVRVVSEAIRNTQEDSLGRGTVIYWPDVQFEEEQGEEEEIEG